MEGTNQRIEKHKATVYKTDHYCQWQVAHLQQSANKQDKRIARWYWKHPNIPMSPSHLHNGILFPGENEEWPLSSTKRSITTLTKKGILIKTKQTCKSTRGGTEHKWRWRRPEEIEDEEKQPDNLKKKIQEPEQMDAFGIEKSKPKGPYAEERI